MQNDIDRAVRRTMRLFWYKRLQLLTAVISIVVLSIGVNLAWLYSRPVYTAETTLTMLPLKSELSYTSSRADFAGLQPALILTQTHTEFFLSRQLSREVANQFLSEKDSSQAKEGNPIVDKLVKPAVSLARRLYLLANFGMIRHKSEAEVLADELRESIRVRNVPGSYILSVSVRWDNPELAARAANLIADKYIRLNRQDNQRSQTMARNVIKHKLDEYTSELMENEKKIMEFKERSSIQYFPKDIEIKFDDLSRYMNQKTSLSIDLMELHAQKAGLKDVQSQAEKAELEAKIASKEAALENVSAIIRKRDRELSAIPIIEYQYSELLNKKQEITDAIAGLRRDLTNVYVSEASVLSQVRVIDEAVPPLYPSQPKVLLNVISSVIAGSLLLLLGLFALESAGKPVRAPDNIPEGAYSFVGVIPRTRKSRSCSSIDHESVDIRSRHIRAASARVFTPTLNPCTIFVDSIRGPADHGQTIWDMCKSSEESILVVCLDQAFSSWTAENIDFSDTPAVLNVGVGNANYKVDLQTRAGKDTSPPTTYFDATRLVKSIPMKAQIQFFNELLNKTQKVYSCAILVSEPFHKYTYSQALRDISSLKLLIVRASRVSTGEVSRYLERFSSEDANKRHIIIDDIDCPLDFQFS